MNDEVFVSEDRLERTLFRANDVSLIKIPPPVIPDALVVDINQWDLKEEVWKGKLKFVMTEFIMNMNIADMEERQIIQGNIQLINTDTNDIFGNIPYTMDGHNIKVTTSRSIYSVVLEHQEKKLGLGLKFNDRSKAQDFDIALQDFKKDAKATLATHEDLMHDLEQKFNSIDLRSPNETHVEHADDDSDLEFGDFVTSQ